MAAATNGHRVMSGVVLPPTVRSVPNPNGAPQRPTMAVKNPRTRNARAGAQSARQLLTLGDPFAELGTSGLRNFGGFVLEEWLAQLRGRKGAWAYREMMDNSPVAGGIIFAVKMLARQVEWSVENDINIGQDEGFVEGCMNDMTHTWGDFVSEALSMLGYGWSLHEEVFKRRNGGDPLPVTVQELEGEGDPRTEEIDEHPPSSKFNDGRIGWRRLPVRAQETLFRWLFRGYSSLRAMEQLDWKGGKHIIPISKALLFRTETTRQNPEGRSILRNCWTSYYMIQNIQSIEAIGIERDLAGIPVAAPPPGTDIYSAEQAELLAEVKDMVQSIRRDEDEGIVLPTSEWTLELLSTGGSRQIDTDKVIRRYENRMLTAVLADFLMIGQDGMGSYAMVDVKSELFGIAVDVILDMICEVFNRYAIPRLLALNNMRPTKLPKITHSSAGRIDLRLVGEFLVNLSLAGAQIPWSKTLLEHLFGAGALPTPEWENLMAPAQPSPVAHDSQWRPSWGDESKTGEREGGPPPVEPRVPGPAAAVPKPPPVRSREHVSKADGEAAAQALAARRQTLSTQLEREMQGALSELGDRAARAYASIDGRDRSPDELAGSVIARTGVSDWQRSRLHALLRNHAGRVAQDTARTVATGLGRIAPIDEHGMRRIVAAGGKHLKTRDLTPQVRDSIRDAIAESRESNDQPGATVERIRQAVPKGRFRLAGAPFRAHLIADTETGNLQRQAAIEAYRGAGGISAVQEYSQHGPGDTLTLDEASAAAAEMHPLDTTAFVPA